MCAGGSSPKSRITVGAMSIRPGSSASIGWLAEEDAGHEARIDDVVPAPGLHVVLEDGARGHPGGAVPRRPVPLVEPDQQVGRLTQVGAR